MKVALESHAVEDADLARLKVVGFSQDDVWDIAAIAAFFALSNRMANVTSMRPKRKLGRDLRRPEWDWSDHPLRCHAVFLADRWRGSWF
jgi:hypothetical protein